MQPQWLSNPTLTHHAWFLPLQVVPQLPLLPLLVTVSGAQALLPPPLLLVALGAQALLLLRLLLVAVSGALAQPRLLLLLAVAGTATGLAPVPPPLQLLLLVVGTTRNMGAGWVAACRVHSHSRRG